MKASELIAILKGINPDEEVFLEVKKIDYDGVEITPCFYTGDNGAPGVELGWCARGAGYPDHYISQQEMYAWAEKNHPNLTFDEVIDKGWWVPARKISTQFRTPP